MNPIHSISIFYLQLDFTYSIETHSSLICIFYFVSTQFLFAYWGLIWSGLLVNYDITCSWLTGFSSKLGCLFDWIYCQFGYRFCLPIMAWFQLDSHFNLTLVALIWWIHLSTFKHWSKWKICLLIWSSFSIWVWFVVEMDSYLSIIWLKH